MAGRHARATETASENGSHCWAEQHRAPGKRRRGWASEVEAGTTGWRCTRRRREGAGGYQSRLVWAESDSLSECTTARRS